MGNPSQEELLPGYDHYPDNEILKRRYNQRLNKLNDLQYTCVGNNLDPQARQFKETCEADMSPENKPQTPGIWDKPCLSDDECPFYMANKNYPNERGGCVNGSCEFHINMERKGFRYFAEDKVPFCYNCPDSKLDCCDEQQKNNTLMVSPDYIFLDDIHHRFDNKETLAERNLDWKL